MCCRGWETPRTRPGRRLFEQRIEERKAILLTAKLGLTLDKIRARLDRLDG